MIGPQLVNRAGRIIINDLWHVDVLHIIQMIELLVWVLLDCRVHRSALGTLIQQRDWTMKTLPMRLTLIVFALFLATVAQGQSDGWYVAPAIVYTDDDADRVIADSVAGAQIAFGHDMTEHLTFEGLLGYSRIEGWVGSSVSYPDQNHLEISANLLAYLDRDRVFSPYLLFGIGYLRADLDPGGSDDRPTGTLGVGFKWRMGQSRFSIRGEYRARLAYKSGDNLTDNIASLGVQYRFGGKKSVPTLQDNADTDADGVLDIWDVCPDTELGTQVGSTGCPLRDREADGDGDRIPDSKDECPNTRKGNAVDLRGCTLDSDRDGVMSGEDRCPASRPDAVVDQFGCSRDDDGDSVPYHLDDCPDTVAGARVDVFGCEIKDVIRLPGVNFVTGSDRILAGSESILGSAAETLKMHPDLEIEVAGHTDSVGQGDSNYSLSERRAKSVRDLLITRGVDATRLTARGYGESQPVADNETAQGRADNRRVELRIVKRQ